MTTSSFDADELEQLDMMIDMVNGQMGDSVAMLARWAEDTDAIPAATLNQVDPDGVTLTADHPEGKRESRIDFDNTLGSINELAAAMNGVLTLARLARPHEPMTALEELLNHDDDDLGLHRCTVTAVEELSPRLRAVTVSGLEGAENHGGDQAVSLVIDLPDRPIPADLDAASYRAMGDDVRPKGSTYSIRTIDTAAGTATFWIVVHGNDPATVAGWATTVSVGDPLVVVGPHEGIATVGEPTSFLGICDETGMAAIAATVDELPADTTVRIVAEIDEPGHEIDITDRPGVEVTWSYRSEADPGSDGRLADDVKGLVTEPVDGLFIMGAGESRCLTTVRTYLRHEVGLPASQVSLIPYWRRPRR